MSGIDVIHTRAFEDMLIEIGSVKLAMHIEHLEALLKTMPDMGSPQLREFLANRYGPGLRKLVVGKYDVIYRHTGQAVIMLAIIPATLVP